MDSIKSTMESFGDRERFMRLRVYLGMKIYSPFNDQS